MNRKSKRKTLGAGLFMLALLLLSALLAPVLVPADPLALDLTSALMPPGTPGHLLGTDSSGGICSPASSGRAERI